MIGRLDPPAPEPAAPPTPPPPIPAGTRLQARLSSPVDTAARRPVEVRVTRSLVREGRVLVPRGTRFLGTARAQDGRVVVRFDRHVRPGATPRPADAVALGADGRPGIPSADRLTGADEAAGLTLPPGTSLVVVLGAPIPVP